VEEDLLHGFQISPSKLLGLVGCGRSMDGDIVPRV